MMTSASIVLKATKFPIVLFFFPRQQVRAKLKEQVKEKDDLHRKQLIERVAESDQAVALDQKNKLEDNESQQKKAAYLKQFSNENKKVSCERYFKPKLTQNG